jgi:hypothetical protein
MKWALRFLKVIYVALIAALPIYALADNYQATVGSGTTFGSHVVTAVNYAEMMLCDFTAPSTQCAAVSSGGAVSTTAAQATAANLNATVVGTGTFAVQATQAGIWTDRIVGNLGGVFDFAGQNAASPANALLAGCQFNTTPTTITSTNASPCQLDNAGNLLVNVKTATGLTQGSTTSGQTGSLVMGAVTTAAPSYTTAQTNALSLDTAGNLRVNVTTNGAANQSVNVAQFGGVSTATGQVAVNTAPVTATNTALVVDLRPDSPGIVTLGQTTKSASVPVTIASDQYVDPCQSPNIAKSSVPISVTSATTTSLVATSGSTTVYVCGFSISIAPSATSADTALFERGTGAACVTTQASLTGTFGNGDLTTAAPPTVVTYGGAGQTVFKSAGTDAICLVTAGTTVNVQGVMTYVQQ